MDREGGSNRVSGFPGDNHSAPLVNRHHELNEVQLKERGVHPNERMRPDG